MTKNIHQPIFGWRAAVLALVLVLAIAGVPAMAGLVLPADDRQETVHAKMLQLPLSFIENKGQAPDDVKFHVAAAGHTISFAPDSVILRTSQANNDTLETAEVRMMFDGASQGPSVTGIDPLPGKANFFIGSDASQWETDVPTFSAVRYNQLYPGIDLVYRGTEGVLKREFIVAPEADHDQIAIRYSGPVTLDVADNGDLLIKTPLGLLTDEAPVAYQEIGGSRIPVQASYRIIDEKTVGFTIGYYNPAYKLVIDPTLIYSTYLGGSGSGLGYGMEYGYGIKLDGEKAIYVTGNTNSVDFPITPGAYQGALAGGGPPSAASDVYVTKFNPSGSALEYSTFIGDPAGDQGKGLVVDSEGNVYVTGKAGNATGFPSLNQSPGLTRAGNNNGGFVLKLDSTGALMYSSAWGGSGATGDDGNCIAVDDVGNVYIGGSTAAGVPMVNPIQGTIAGGTDGFVMKISADGSTVLNSTYYGGNAEDYINAIAVDPAGNVYIGGETSSTTNFPLVNAMQAANGGGTRDCFIAKIGNSWSAYDYSTFIGSTGNDAVYGMAVDSTGAAFICGKAGTGFPMVNPADGTLGGTTDNMVAKINPAGTGFAYSTYWGSTSAELGFNGITIDSAGNVYTVGSAAKSDCPTVNSTQAWGGGTVADALVAKFNATGGAEYVTFFGGSSAEWAISVAVDDSTGNAYVFGHTNGGTIPLKNPYDSTYGASRDAFVAIISPLSVSVANFTATPLTGPYPLTVQFTDLSTNNPTSWNWQFGDGTLNSTDQNPSHIYTTAGNFTVRLTATNSVGNHTVTKANLINVTVPIPTISVIPNTTALASGSTTQYQLMVDILPTGLSGFNLTVSLDHPAIGEITAVSIPSWAALNGTSTLPADIASFNAVDLNKQVEPGATNVLLGTVTVRADTSGTTGINVTVRKMDDDNGDAILPVINNGQLQVFAPLVANFSAEPLSGYRPLTVNFTDLSTGSPTAWAWIFGDLTPEDTTQNPTHTYTAAGNYTVNLTASNAYNSDSEVKALYIQVQVLVLAFPGYTNLPTDPDGDGLYEDINGNGRLDFDDVVAYYSSMAWMSGNADVGTNPYDYNHNGRIDFDDVVVLYEEVLVW